MSLKQLLKSVWLYSWVLIIPLIILASFTDLLLLGGIRLFLSLVSDSIKIPIHFTWLENVGILHWAILMLVLIAMRYLFTVLRVRSEERFRYGLESHLRLWWIRMVKNLHPFQFHKQETDSILNNANQSISTISRACKLVTQSMQAVSQLLFFLPVLFLLSWQLTLLLLFVFTPIILYLQKIFKNADKGADEYNRYSGEYDVNIWQWVAIRKYWNNHAELSKYLSLILEKIRNLKKSLTDMGVRDVTIIQNIETLSILIMSIVMAACAGLIKMGAMEPFQIILFCAALIICYKPLKECSQLFSNLKDLKIAYIGLNNLESMKTSLKFFKEKDEEYISMENVSFKYRDDSPWVFQSLSNAIKLNRPVMLQGINGSGKTTLLRILSGLEIPQDGSIYMPPKIKEGSFYFSQRLFLPPISWLEQAINEKKWSATIQNFFDVLGLESLLKKDGHSNGEMQRIGFAWAVVSGAPFLFLDEPFAYISRDLKEPIFKAFWNATTETDQWWMMASHELPPAVYQERINYWKLETLQ
jgi:ABC-type bacteriocin/lantibiotic exporter with double-glycine peptidase domain